MTFEKLFKLVFAAWVVATLISLTVVGVLVYIGIHFAAKYW